MKTTSPRSKPMFVLPYSVVFSKEYNDKHYYVAVYAQEWDETNPLGNDIYGLVISTNEKYERFHDDYNVEVIINDRKAFVCCDKWFRLKKEFIRPKKVRLTEQEKTSIKEKIIKFQTEVNRQLGIRRDELK